MRYDQRHTGDGHCPGFAELSRTGCGPVVPALPLHAYRLRLNTDGDIEWVAQENGTEVIYRTEPHTSFWRRFTVGFLRLLPIEGQL